MQHEIEGLIDLLSPLAEGAKDCIDALEDAKNLLSESAFDAGEALVSDIKWLALRNILAWVLPDFGRISGGSSSSLQQERNERKI